jgi:hypothetical protein
MHDCCADAISVEQKATYKKQRAVLGEETLYFGKFFAWSVTCDDPPEKVDAEIRQEMDDGFNAIWPSCDLWPDVIPESMLQIGQLISEHGKEIGYPYPKPKLTLDRQDDLEKIRDEYRDWFIARQDRLDKYEYPWDMSKVLTFGGRKPEDMFVPGYDLKNSKMIYK